MTTATMPKSVKVMRDKSTGTLFYVIGPLGEIFRLQRIGLGLSAVEVANKANVHISTIYRRETDRNKKGSWGYLRTNVHIMNALGLQLLGMKE